MVKIRANIIASLVALTLILGNGFGNNSAPQQKAARASAAGKPRLVVVLVLDQFRADYLTRFDKHLSTDGFKALKRTGAVFTSAHYSYASTYTGPGHALILSGSYGHTNGIIGNKWFNYKSGKSESMMYDPESKIIGAPETTSDDETSPRNFIGNNLSDQLRIASGFKSKAIAVALKDRAAIMLAGKLGQAYWFFEGTGQFTSSTYYAKDVPTWVKAFNAATKPEAFYNKAWEKSLSAGTYLTEDASTYEADFKGLGTTFPHTLTDKSGKPGPDFYEAFTATPFGTDYELEFARTVIEKEHLGEDDDVDILGISITATDIAGHAYGPESQEVQDLIVRTDAQIGRFLKYLDTRFKPGEVILALTADHGAAPTPEFMKSIGIDAGRIRKKQISDAVEAALDARFGDGKWVLALEDPSVYLNRRLIADKKLDRMEVEHAAGEALMAIEGIAGYFTRSDLISGRLPAGWLAAYFEKSFHPERSGDLLIVTKPFYFWGKYGEKDQGSTHGSPYEYDTHVPLILVGSGVRAGTYNARVDVADLAPTLAVILGINAPAACEGRVLAEALK